MAVIFSLITLGAFVAYFSYIQLKMAIKCDEKKEKLFVLLILGLFIYSNFAFYYNVDIVYPWDLILNIVYFLVILVFWSFHLLYKHVLKKEKRLRNEVDEDFQEKKGHLFEVLRKMFHLIFFIGLLVYVFVFFYIAQSVLINFPNALVPPTETGTSPPVSSSEGALFDLFGSIYFDPDPTHPKIMEVAMIIFFQIATPLILLIEYFRINPKLSNPLQPLFKRTLRPFELTNPSNFYYFSSGMFICAIFLPIAAVFGILCVLVFGDSMASIIGKRVKERRHSIRWENEKCWEGSIAGMSFTFLSVILFMGPFYALILSILFLCIDITTPKVLRTSDNFITPLVCALLVFILLIMLKIDPIAPLASIFSNMNTYFFEFTPELIWG